MSNPKNSLCESVFGRLLLIVLLVAVLFVALFAALRAHSQDFPMLPITSELPTEAELVVVPTYPRTVAWSNSAAVTAWEKDTLVRSYTNQGFVYPVWRYKPVLMPTSYALTVNGNLFLTTKTVISNAAFVEGTNLIAVTASNTNGISAATMLRWGIFQERSEDYIGWFYSSDGINNWTPTNPPPNGRLKPRKNGNGFFQLMSKQGTNYIVEGPL